MTNDAAKMARAMSSSGVTALREVSFVISLIMEPASIGVSVAASEFSEPPVWMSWLPRLPPPPSRFSIGLTTVFRMQTQKPHTKAPSR